jgi:hypothetical protein
MTKEKIMANTSFAGPIRSKNGVELYSVTSSTGVEHNRTVGDWPRDARRWYLEEWFKRRPGLNANLDQASTVEVQRTLNYDWEVAGTNMTSALVTFPADAAGILATTATTDQDQAIIYPHLDNDGTADTGAITGWSGVQWGTENQVHWETSIRMPAIDNQKVFCGLKLTGTANGQLVATDDDQAYFKFQTDATNSEAFTDFTLWHFVHSIGGTDYISALPITVAANTNYHLKIKIDSDRKATIYVNGVQYNVTSTAGSTGGTAVTAVQPGTAATKTAALTDNVDFIPYNGIECGAGAAEALNTHFICMSRMHYE